MQQQPFQQPSWLEVERTRAAVGRSYTSPAVVTMVLYLIFWLPGIIANLVYLNEANRTRNLTGQSPDGMGCLWAALIAFNLPVIVFIVILFGSFMGTVAHLP